MLVSHHFVFTSPSTAYLATSFSLVSPEHLGHTEGFLKDAEIAYVGTHRHASDKDEAYEFTYMFKFGMDIPKGATTVTLPDHADIVLFAATLVNEKYPAVTPASELFRTALKLSLIHI